MVSWTDGQQGSGTSLFMGKYTASYEFPQNPDCIYGILSDVERMSEFMPLCKRSQVLSRQSTPEAEIVKANFLLRYRQVDFERDFDLVFTLRSAERSMEVATIDDNAFGSGAAQCTVTGAGRTGSRVLFQTDYRVKNSIVRLFFAKRLLRHGVDRVMDRVRQRAETSGGW